MDYQTLIQSLQDQITNLQAQLDALKSATTIPFEIGEAFQARVGGNGQFKGLSSSAIQTVNAVTGINFASSTFTTTPVSAPMVGFIDAIVSNNAVKIPKF